MHWESESLVTFSQIAYLARLVIEDYALRTNVLAGEPVGLDDFRRHFQHISIAFRVAELLRKSIMSPATSAMPLDAFIDSFYVWSFIANAGS